MFKQIPHPPSRFRKGFLIIGIVLLILGLFFFYVASRVNWDYVTTYNDVVQLAYPTFASNYSGLGYSYEYFVRYVIVQHDDYLTVSYLEPNHVNGTVHIIMWQASMRYENALGYNDDGFAYFTNNQSNYILVEVGLMTQYVQNATISMTTILNHYEKPQLVYFGVGAVLSSLAAVTISKFKERMISRKMLGLIMAIIGFVFVVSGEVMFFLEPRTFVGIPGCFCVEEVGPPPIYCYKTLHGLMFDSGLVLVALGIVLMIVFRKEKLLYSGTSIKAIPLKRSVLPTVGAALEIGAAGICLLIGIAGEGDLLFASFPSPHIQYLVMGVFGFLGFALGLKSAAFTLRREHFRLSISGMSIEMLSGLITILGFSTLTPESYIVGLMFGMPTIFLSVLSLAFTAMSKGEFA